MHPIQRILFDTNFKGISGARIEGTLALSEALINLGVLDALQRLQQPKASEDVLVADKAAPAAPDPGVLLKAVQVDTLKIRTDKGKIHIDLKAGIK